MSGCVCENVGRCHGFLTGTLSVPPRLCPVFPLWSLSLFLPSCVPVYPVTTAMTISF